MNTSYPIFTDTPASKKQRQAALRLLNAQLPKQDDHEKRLAMRIICRQWGNATPAQALLVLSQIPDAKCTVPEAHDLSVMNFQRVGDLQATADRWNANATIKECNALIRLSSAKYHTAGRDRFIARAAWLVTASQEDIQCYLHTLSLPAPLAGNIDPTPKHGCRGFFRQSELFPRQHRLTAQQDDLPNTITDWFTPQDEVFARIEQATQHAMDSVDAIVNHLLETDDDKGEG